MSQSHSNTHALTVRGEKKQRHDLFQVWKKRIWMLSRYDLSFIKAVLHIPLE